MGSPPEPLSEALRLLIVEDDESTAHPSPDELIAYSERELEEAEQRRIRRHLSVCADCARTVLDLETFPDVELRDADLRLSGEEEEDDWQVLQQRLAIERPSPDLAPVRVRPVPRLRLRSRKGPELAIAALLAVAVGLGLWTARLYWRIEALTRELGQPRTDVFVSDLEPASSIRNSGDEPVMRLPAGTRQLVLILNLEDLRLFPDYGVEILDERDVILWRKQGLKRGPEGNFTLSLPLSILSPGPCKIRLYGLADSRKNLLAAYRIRIGFESG